MSKGWESKSVEEQQAEASAPVARLHRSERRGQARRGRPQAPRPVPGMQRERVLSERTSSPHRRSALELALATIERELEQLGWSIKL